MASRKSKRGKQKSIPDPAPLLGGTGLISPPKDTYPLFSFYFLVQKNKDLFREKTGGFLSKMRGRMWSSVEQSSGFDYKSMPVNQCKRQYQASFKNAKRKTGTKSDKIVQMRVNGKDRIYGIRDSSIFHVIGMAPHDVF